MTAAALPSWTTFSELPFAHGGPVIVGRLRATPADFQVEEILDFDPDGEGDHLLLWVRKTGANTEWVARRLAALVGAQSSNVGFAGLKDRHAITTQWFSVPRPRGGEPDWASLVTDGIEVLEVHPHRRKLKRGALSGNRFRILVREATGDTGHLEARLQAIRSRGVPNYFGEQRFGRQDANLPRAHALFLGEAGRVPRHLRSLFLSAARSQIFNEVLRVRVTRDDWDRVLTGDCLQLAGCNSHFVANELDDELVQRCARMDLHPSGPLWGRGLLPVRGAVRTLEEEVVARFAPWREGLERFGLDQERRALRLAIEELSMQQQPDGLLLSFALPAGTYATSVLRELVSWDDAGAAGPS